MKVADLFQAMASVIQSGRNSVHDFGSSVAEHTFGYDIEARTTPCFSLTLRVVILPIKSMNTEVFFTLIPLLPNRQEFEGYMELC